MIGVEDSTPSSMPIVSGSDLREYPYIKLSMHENASKPTERRCHNE
ncbi:MAG: hypothetical protein NC087_10255 [Anaeroplasma bactoclasticum]|nr:hypothetical protein [Anaeroplasma bactoclasticum]